MHSYSLSHLADDALCRDLAIHVAQENAATAVVLAHIAEFDARRLYLPAGYPSMYAYCVGALRLSEDAAYKRIQAARSARQFPAIVKAVAGGRLHLAGVCLLAPHLAPGNGQELLVAASGKSKVQIEELLAQRFPRTELLPMVEAIPAPTPPQLAPGQVEPSVPQRVEAPAPRPQVAPVALERFGLQLTIGQSTREKLRYAQELLGHTVAAGDLAVVLDRALDALIARLEQKKFAKTSKPRRSQGSANPRHIPASVKRAVWARDRGRCTFVSDNGHRCEATTRLEFDHIEPVASGGQSTGDNIRLRCRPHNQFAAERTFGTDFMRHKREQARQASHLSGP